MIDDETRAKALAQVRGIDKASATEYEDEWAADKQATDAQDAADKGVAAGKKADAESDFEFADEPTPKPAAKPTNFKAAFKAARLAGEKDFGWTRPDGTPYRVSTALKSEAADSSAKPDAARTTTSPRVNASPPAAKPAPRAIQAPEPRASMTQKLGSDYAALKQAADTMPAGTSAQARSALNDSVGRSQRAYEQAAGAEKAGTPVVKRASPTAAKPMALRIPDQEDDGIGPVYFNQPGGTLLAGGKKRGESAIIPDDRMAETPTVRRGYKS